MVPAKPGPFFFTEFINLLLYKDVNRFLIKNLIVNYLI